jgi:uncharacterized protein (DUF488 family)
LGHAPYTPVDLGLSTTISFSKVVTPLKKGALAENSAKCKARTELQSDIERAMTADRIELWTIGHSTLPSERLIEVLRSFEIEVLADVRSFPGSRRYPQFNKDQLKVSLAAVGVEYQHYPELGGRRNARPDSLNMAWRNKMFRGYADYMETGEFRLGIARLVDVAKARRTAIMCAEAVWWRCHRSLISDYLKASGVGVTHIMAAGKSEPHPFTSAARIVNGELSYRGILES